MFSFKGATGASASALPPDPKTSGSAGFKDGALAPSRGTGAKPPALSGGTGAKPPALPPDPKTSGAAGFKDGPLGPSWGLGR